MGVCVCVRVCGVCVCVCVCVCVLCRRGRETGVRDEGEVEAPEQLFDYVPEEEYQRLVKKRQGEAFILDDGEKLWWLLELYPEINFWEGNKMLDELD